MPYRCIFGCPFKPDIALHMFPNPNKELKRFQQWVKLVGGLRGDTFDDFYKKRKICDIHFSEDYKHKNKLNAFAIPTLFLKGRNSQLPSYRGPTSQQNSMMQEEYLDYDLLDEETTFYSVQDDKSKNNLVHEGFKCNVCQTEIIGFRYVCVECSDWDMCGACEARGEHPHHLMLRVPTPRPYAEIRTVLESIRESLCHEPKLIKKCDVNIDEDEIEDIVCPVETLPESEMEAEYLELSDDNFEPSNHQTIKSPTKFNISPSKFNITPPKLTKFGSRMYMKSKRKNSSVGDHTPSPKVHKVEMSNGKKYLNQGDRLVKKVTEVLKLRIPSGINVDSLQKSLKKDLVVKINRLPKHSDDVIKEVKDKKGCKKKEIPIT